RVLVLRPLCSPRRVINFATLHIQETRCHQIRKMNAVNAAIFVAPVFWAVCERTF
ncbi:MAG: hypothetical protein ACI932_000589, partial [Paracoccaceae bacterium]